MTQFASYSLGEDAAIQHWLACGVVTSPIENLADVLSPTGSPFGEGNRWILNFWAYHPQSVALKRRLYDTLPALSWQPDAPPTLNSDAMGGQRWTYRLAEEDQTIDFSTFNFSPQLMQGWTFAYLVADEAMTVEAKIITIGPVHCWLNDALVLHYQAAFSYVAPMFIPVTLDLKAGMNPLYLHGEMFGWREARLALGLRFKEAVPLKAAIPLGDIDAEQWEQNERASSHLTIKQFAFPDPPGTIQLGTDAPTPITLNMEAAISVTGSPWAKFGELKLPYGASQVTLHPGESAPLPITEDVAEAMSHLPGENALTLTIRPDEDIPLAIKRHVWSSGNAFSSTPYSDYESRRREALEHLAQMPYDVLAAMAAVEAGHAKQIDSGAVTIALTFMQNRHDCADFYAIQLLALLYRFGDQPVLKPEDRQRIEATFTSFKFWIDEPGLDGMCYFTENHQILFHVTAYLTGQYWRERIFTNSGYSGTEQMGRAYPRIENWILRRLRGGYSEWDSNAYLALDIYAMLAIVEFAENNRLQDMATTLLHKTLFMVVSQSFRGVHGSSHGRCYVEGLKSARVENTSSIQRIAWGMGIFNGETRATGLLSMARRYQLPEILQRIGADVDSTLITRARSHAEYRPEYDMHPGAWDVRTVTYRSSQVMLAAAVDYRPGEMGVQEHLWQATLSPEAVVFTNYPGNSQEHGHARPNFWAGSVRLPRVAMHQKTLICLYPIADDVGLGFSHAYFPTAAFDEYRIEGQWAFARWGDGYIALWGDGDLTLTTSGKHAYQELRSANNGHVWICHVGQASDDGDFAAFQSAVMTQQPTFESGVVNWKIPDGDSLRFAWEGAFRLNDEPQSWDDFPHYENAYTQTPMNSEQMIITHTYDRLVLDLKNGRWE